MPSLTTLVMIAWIPLILVSFSMARPRRAVIAAYLAGWMLLPIISWDLPGLPSYDKLTATNLGVLAGILLFDLNALLRLRPMALDLPVLILCLCPIGSSLSHGLGLYDGLAGAWQKIITWSIPWIVGRCYFGSLEGMYELAKGMFIAGALYVPLCVYEMVYGATLHLKVYGFSQHIAEQTLRSDGSIRPMVFMHHGLMVSIWMGACSLAGLSLTRGARLAGFLARRRPVVLAALIATFVLSRSLAATVLIASGVAAWSVSRITRMALPVLLLVAVVPTYVTLRATGALATADMSASISSGMEALGASPREISARVVSATTRFIAEDELCREGWQHPVFGANSWNIGLFVDPQTGELQSTTVDGLWAILFATRGLVGLGSWMLMLLLPVLVFVRRHPPGTWRHPLVSAASILAVVLTAHALDCMLNSDGTPMYICIAGGLAGLPAARGFRRPVPAAHQRRSAPNPGPGAVVSAPATESRSRRTA